MLSVFEIIVLGIFGLAFVWSTDIDRYQNGCRNAPKWFVLVVFIICVAIWQSANFVVIGPAQSGEVDVWDLLRSASFWSSAAIYVGLGLLYSIVEFVVQSKHIAKSFKEEWHKFLKSQIWVTAYVKQPDGKYAPVTNSKGGVEKVLRVREDILRDGSRPDAYDWQVGEAQSVFRAFSKSEVLNFDSIVRLDKDYAACTMTPSVNPGPLAEAIGAWVIFWPAYLVSLIIGDGLFAITRAIVKVTSKAGNKIVRSIFGDVFKV